MDPLYLIPTARKITIAASKVLGKSAHFFEDKSNRRVICVELGVLLLFGEIWMKIPLLFEMLKI